MISYHDARDLLYYIIFHENYVYSPRGFTFQAYMTAKTRSFLKAAGIYTVANFANAAIPFLLLPFLTNYLSTEDYALVSMFQVLVNAVLPFIGLNGNSALVRQYFDREKIDFPVYVGNAIYILFGSTLVMVLVFGIFGNLISRFSAFPSEWLWTVLVFATGQKMTEYMLSIWRVQHKAIPYSVFRLLRTSLDIGLSIFFIIAWTHTWEGRIEGQVVTVAFFALIAAYYLVKGNWIKLRYNKAYLIHALKFGVPLIPHVLGAAIITYSDRLFITHMVSLSAMGLYSVGYQVGMVVSLIQSSFNQAWSPWFYEQLKLEDPGLKRKIVTFTWLFFAAMILCVLVVTFLSPYFFKIFVGEEFKGGGVFVFWIALGFGFNGMYKMAVNYLFYLKQTVVIAQLTFATALLNLVLNYLLIRSNGAIGAAQATALSFLFQFLLAWIISARRYPMPWFGFFRF